MKKEFAIMYHHFHDDKDINKIQGSLNAEQFEESIIFLKENYNLINPEQWFEKLDNKTIKEKDVCVTFDDALKSQFDIALPILEKYNLKAIWSIYTSVTKGKLELLEIFRHFRCLQFSNIDEFYVNFFREILRKNNNMYQQECDKFEKLDYLKNYEFYSENDRKYRYFRNEVLTNEQYEETYFELMKEKNFNMVSESKKIWLSKEDIKHLADNGHTIAIHSETHPTQIGKFNYNEQFNEYSVNHQSLTDIIGYKPYVATYPCGSYNGDTESIMNDLGIKYGFCSNMNEPIDTRLFKPRLDHTGLSRYKER